MSSQRVMGLTFNNAETALRVRRVMRIAVLMSVSMAGRRSRGLVTHPRTTAGCSPVSGADQLHCVR